MTTQTFRRNFIFPLFSLAALAGTSACSLLQGYVPAVPASADLTEISMPVVTGTATYRERMIAPEGSVLKVMLQDTSRADAAAVTLAEWTGTLDDGGVPKAFTLKPEAPLDPGMTYTVRAVIHDPAGELLWTTDTAHRVPVDVASAIDIGELVMVMVVPSEPPPPPIEGDWIIEAIGEAPVTGERPPQITFGKDGRVSGFTGCNRFMGGYTHDSATLSFSPVAMTMMACLSEAAGRQESALGAALAGDAAYAIDESGLLTLTGTDGTVITAKKAPDLSLAGSEWIVTAMGGTGIVSGREPDIVFTADGKVNGKAGCNIFFGDYTQEGDRLTTGSLGLTRMNCEEPGVMAQEAKFVSILQGETKVSFDATGKLMVTGAKGVSFTAERLDAAGSEAGADPAQLSGGEWRVEDINRGGVIDNSHLTLTFGEDGYVSGSTNCNTFRGSFKTTRTGVTFSPLAMTKKACIGEALANQEQAYMAALSGEMTWTITADGALELTGDGGRRVLLRRG